MHSEIEKLINDEANGHEIKLHGRIAFNVDKSGSFTMGKWCVKGIITVMRSDVVIDGSDAVIEVHVDDCTTSDWSLFFIHPHARNVQMRNMNVKVYICNPTHCTKTFSVIYNTTYGCKIDNCILEMVSDKQLNMAGIYNNGNLDTHMNTRADNLAVSNCNITAECRAEEYIHESTVYGIYNYLANSTAVTNTFVYVVNKGVGGKQRAIGVYTNGRFGRYIGNNFKANGTHNIGAQKEQAHAFGFINDGVYSIITSDNIVAEWAGMCVGLENSGEYAVIANNKILATHTICGRSIRNYGDAAKIRGNVLTSTSRNARLIEQNARDCIIAENSLDMLMVRSECQSGCGIYGMGERNARNTIRNNIIRNVTNCGIFANESIGSVADNTVLDSDGAVVRAGSENRRLAVLLDERNIRSL